MAALANAPEAKYSYVDLHFFLVFTQTLSTHTILPQDRHFTLSVPEKNNFPFGAFPESIPLVLSTEYSILNTESSILTTHKCV